MVRSSNLPSLFWSTAACPLKLIKEGWSKGAFSQRTLSSVKPFKKATRSVCSWAVSPKG